MTQRYVVKKVTLVACSMETELDYATPRRSHDFRTISRAAHQHRAAFVGSRLASLQCNSRHHRQAQRGRHEHGAAPAGEPSAPPSLQDQANVVGRLGESGLQTVVSRGAAINARLQAVLVKDSNADALPGANARANIVMNVATSTQEPIMTPRISDNIRSLVTIIGGNAIPPRDPNDDDDDNEDEEEDEDGDEDPAVVREPDE